MNVTKLELCTRVAKKLDKTSITELKPILEIFLDEILGIMAEGYRIEIRGFGCFKPVTRKKRIGRNPRTGDVVEIPPYTAPYFRFSKEAQKTFDEKLKASPAKAILPDQVLTSIIK
jgi:integration host factor subunit beta